MTGKMGFLSAILCHHSRTVSEESQRCFPPRSIERTSLRYFLSLCLSAVKFSFDFYEINNCLKTEKIAIKIYDYPTGKAA